MPSNKLINNNLKIIIVLFFGLILRLIAINQSLWLDEAISFQLVSNQSFIANLSHFMKGDFNPPLYNIILHFWLKFFPATELFIRLPSVIFGLFTCFFVYKMGKFFNKNIALFSLILLTTSPLHIYYSQEARMYSLAAFTTTASMYYFLKLIKTKNPLFIISYSLFTILMLYSHYLCWLILPVQLLYVFMHKNKKIFLNYLITCPHCPARNALHIKAGGYAKHCRRAQLLITLSVIPLFPLLIKQLNIGQGTAQENPIWNNVVGGLSFKSVALLPIKFIIGRTSFDNNILYGFIISLLGLLFGYLLWQARKNSEKLIWFWLIIPPLLGVVISFKIPVFSYFRFLFCLPAFYLLISFGINSLKKPKLMIMLVIFINLFFSFRYLLNKNFHRENWKEAVKNLQQLNINRDPVILYENVDAPFKYYDQNKSKIVFAYQKDALVNFETVWFIPYTQPIFDPQDGVRSFLIKNGFNRVFEEHFRGVTLEKWQKLMAFRYN